MVVDTPTGERFRGGGSIHNIGKIHGTPLERWRRVIVAEEKKKGA